MYGTCFQMPSTHYHVGHTLRNVTCTLPFDANTSIGLIVRLEKLEIKIA